MVGAGFASGQEIVLFFSRFGIWAMGSILFVAVAIVWFSQRMMLWANRYPGMSIVDFYRGTFGLRWGRHFLTGMVFVYFLLSTVMLAGAASTLQHVSHMSYWLAAGATVVVLQLTLLARLGGVYRVNGVVVPLLIGCMATLVALAPAPTLTRILPLLAAPPDVPPMAGAALLYFTLNAWLAVPLLLSIGSSGVSPAAIKKGSWLGGIGFGGLLLSSHWLLTLTPTTPGSALPLASIASTQHLWLGHLYSVLLYAEIFTTLVANFYSIGISIRGTRTFRRPWAIPVLLLCCLLLGQLGFATLLHRLYPILGMLSLIWLTLMVARTARRPASTR
jgi:uncharacterized membrane protein YkvI